MRFVQPLVADGMVLPAVNPVNAVVREHQEPTPVLARSEEKRGWYDTYQTIEKSRYPHPYSSTSLYNLDHPWHSPMNQGMVYRVMAGNARKLDWISSLTWFLRNRGCFIISWLKMNWYDRPAKMKYSRWMPIRVITRKDRNWRGR